MLSDFVRALRWAGAALAVVVATFAISQPVRKPYVIGVIFNSPPISDLTGPTPATVAARELVEGLAERGWVDGKNIRIVWKSAEEKPERIPGLVDELLKLPVDVLVTSGTRIARETLKRTRSIPIVMASSSFPVEEGLVASLARPGGNVTGLTSDSEAGLDGKRLALLKQVDPKVSRVAVLVFKTDEILPEPTLAAARQARLSIFATFVGSADQLETAFAEAVRKGANALLVPATPFTYVERNQLAIQRLAARQRIAAIYSTLPAAELGGLMTYANDEWGQFRRASYFVDRILKGAKPADLPIEQPTRLRFEVNLKAARELGLTIPASVLAQADRVIE